MHACPVTSSWTRKPSGCSPTPSAPGFSPRFGCTVQPRPPSSLTGSTPTPARPSHHLRKLESVGLVEDTGEGEGKRRLWQAASRSHGWRTSDFADDDDAATSLNWLTRDYVRTAADHMQRWYDVEHDWSAEWQDALGVSDDVVLVTAAQARELLDELSAVLGRYREAGSGDPDARRISVWYLMHPLDTEQP